MNRSKVTYIFALILLYAVTSVSAVLADSQIVRIGLTSFGGKSLTVSADSGLSVTQTGSSKDLFSAEPESVTITLNGKSIEISSDNTSVDAGTSITVKPVDSSQPLQLTSTSKLSRKYRGSLEITITSGSLRVINIVGLEDYLEGVLPAEMPNSFPLDSLKAQAITARTYTLTNLRKHASKGFDLCDSTDCQTYAGVVTGKDRCVQAVEDTCGQVLTYNSKPAAVFYSTDCGGATRNYCELRPSYDAPYLCGVVDPDDITHIIWQQAYRLPDLESKFVAAGVKEAQGLKEVSVSKTGATGWVMEITVTGQDGSTTITPAKLKGILGSSVIKSCLFTIEMLTDEELVIRGKGWGHGLGLCQTGAKALALPPHNMTCKDILAHYFPGTQISDTSAPSEMAMARTSESRPVSRGKQRKPRVQLQEKEKLPFDVRIHDPEIP